MCASSRAFNATHAEKLLAIINLGDSPTFLLCPKFNGSKATKAIAKLLSAGSLSFHSWLLASFEKLSK
jgi:hypothetical protein